MKGVLKMKLKTHKINLTCSICHADKHPLQEEVTAKCDVCNQEFEADTTCENKHFVCHLCRQKAARGEIIKHCLESAQTDPFELMLELMKLPGVAMHGPEHHLLLTASLLTAFYNVFERNNLSEALEEADRRSIQVPGGACGNWGICGAAIGAGIFNSILTESSPFAGDEWKSCGQLTAKCAGAISEQGGPRCCKRDSFIAFREAAMECNKKFNTDFKIPESIECQFFVNNKECKGRKCPFFPR